jgi:pimeloyl-ACP methyl ester carboxylesterase
MPKNAKNAAALEIPRVIRGLAKFLEFLSPVLAARFAAKLFITPIQHKIPKRELEMARKASTKEVYIEAINKTITVYFYGSSSKKAVLVHGWSGRGTQLFKFADALIGKGFSIISFDAPAHGQSSGKTTMMPEFIACLFELERLYGPFDAGLGHSLGGMSLLNAVSRGFKLKVLVTIGSGDIIKEIIDEFTDKLGVKRKIGKLMKERFERRSPEDMNSYSAHLAAKLVAIPVLVVHDEDDREVPVRCARNIAAHLPNPTLLLTQRLGHRKILGAQNVIDTSIAFIQNNS